MVCLIATMHKQKSWTARPAIRRHTACCQKLTAWAGYATSLLLREGAVARAERLLALIQVLRRHRFPVSGQAIADELGVSLRTVYRDVQTLIGQGAAIDGEAGVGFVLRPGFVLPPLMFTDDEIEALVLGLRFVTQRTDAPLERAAKDALAKIAAVLPEDLRESVAGV